MAQVVVVVGGEIREMDAHDELAARRGEFASLMELSREAGQHRAHLCSLEP